MDSDTGSDAPSEVPPRGSGEGAFKHAGKSHGYYKLWAYLGLGGLSGLVRPTFQGIFNPG